MLTFSVGEPRNNLIATAAGPGMRAVEPATKHHRTPVLSESAVAGFALLALLVGQWMLSSAIHGTNYDGGDGKMAQATILAAIKFGGLFQVNNISPIEGVGSQLLPMNVWINPAYWPFHFLSPALATDVSAMIALACFAIACCVMARCFDLPMGPSAVAAQLCIVLFAPTVLYLQLLTVFCLTPGDAVVYAPHMIALGLLARLEPGSWRTFGLITAGIFALLLYSLSCDPVWTMISGFSWSVAFAVVTLSPLKPKAILVRGAALGCSLVLLFLTGALEYLYTLSQYTARAQFAAVLDRPRLLPYVSTAFDSPATRYYYLACVPGWLLGILALRGRPRVLVLAAAATCALYVGFSMAFLWLKVPWTAPIPVYVEHCVFPLFVAAGVAGYWGALRAAASRLRQPIAAAILRAARSTPTIIPRAPMLALTMIGRTRDATLTMVQRIRIAAIHHGVSQVSVYLWPLSRLLGASAARALARMPCEQAPSRISFAQTLSKLRWLQAQLQDRFAPIVLSFVLVAIVPAAAVDFALNRSAPYANTWYEPYPNEPELVQFLTDNAGRAIGRHFRGSLFFPWYDGHALTIPALWVRGIPTVQEYGQLVTPQALYLLHAVLQKDVRSNLNIFMPFPGPSWRRYLKTLQLLGARYFVADPAGVPPADVTRYPLITVPRRPHVGVPGVWRIYELPRPNIGDYSPTEVLTVGSAGEMAATMREEEFDFTRQVVLSTPIGEPLVPARDMRLSLIRGGLHLSGTSEGTSMVVLPQQFSHCLRARDTRVRIVRADLMLTGVIFSSEIDTDIVFDYGIFTPGCRSIDLADFKRLRMEIDLRVPHLAGRPIGSRLGRSHQFSRRGQYGFEGGGNIEAIVSPTKTSTSTATWIRLKNSQHVRGVARQAALGGQAY